MGGRPPAAPLATCFLSEASPITRIHAVPSRLYVLSMARLRIIDSSSLFHELGSYTTPGTASGMWIDDARLRAYIADTGNGLVILDIADPTAPVLLGTYTALPGASDVSVSGNFAFVADGTAGVHLIDVFDPAAPSDLGQFDRPSGGRLRTLANGNDARVLDENVGMISLRNLAAATAAGRVLPSGVYSYRLTAPGIVQTRKMVLLK